MPTRFTIYKNQYLTKNTIGFYNCYYTGHNKPTNPEYINTLKNTFNLETETALNKARNQVTDILIMDIPEIMKACSFSECILVAIPRAKAFDTYTPKQMYLRDAISDAADKIDSVVNGVSCISRIVNTRTTHLSEKTGRYTTQGSVKENDGSAPYPGITIETCTIDSKLIQGRNVILVDDIYTKNCNIDEDCIQALYDNGAKTVIFYAVAFTRAYPNRKMKYSEMALRTLALMLSTPKLTVSRFWKEYSTEKLIRETITDDIFKLENMYGKILEHLDASVDGFICVFDDKFPTIMQEGKKNNRPFLLFYRGDINLLSDIDNNVAVIGLIDPTPEIETREKNAVNRLAQSGCNIVSGLAKGCDTIAHKSCLDSCGKTIAVLPCAIDDIYPKENQPLAEEIVNKGGLLVSEYYDHTSANNQYDWYDRYKRFIERDRLQAILSKAIILVASYRKSDKDGKQKLDSGARHAMEAAKDYGIKKYVLYDERTDQDDERFALNRFYLNKEREDEKYINKDEKKVDVEVLRAKSIDIIKNTKRYNEEQTINAVPASENLFDLI